MAKAMQPRPCERSQPGAMPISPGKKRPPSLLRKTARQSALREKLGFVKKLETTYKGEPTLIFYRPPRS